MVVIIIFIVVTAGSAIANFFDISFEAFGPYLVWFIAIAIFYFVLPNWIGDLFKSND